MRTVFLLFTAVLALTGCGGAGTGVPVESVPADVTQVLYFHAKQRCVTCNAIEQLAREVVDSLDDARIVLRVVDFSAPENASLAARYEVAWSSLLLDRGGRIENLTQAGFRDARSRPEAFKAEIVRALTKIAE